MITGDAIPLIKPIFPTRNKVWEHYRKSLVAGQLSNFGPCYDEATRRLSCEYGGGYWLISSSGASAIRLALQARLRRGSRVLIPDFTHVGTLHAVVAAGMVPVFGSCDERTWTLSEESITAAAKSCQAVVVVSPFGYRVNFTFYDRLCERYGLHVVYDLAGGFLMDTQGTENTRCYSLHATKSMPCGEGGLVVFSSEKEANLARRLMNFATGPDRLIQSIYADNLKVSELTCAVLLAHLDDIERVKKRVSAKSALIDYYQARLDGFCTPHTLHHGGAAPSLSVVSGLNATKLEQDGIKRGITVRRYYIPLTEMPALSQVLRVGKSSKFFKTCAALPSDVNQRQADMVIDFIIESASNNSAGVK